MKQKEVAKLKRVLNLDNERLSVDKISVGIMSSGEIKYFKKHYFGNMETSEQVIYMNLMKESLGGKMGKAIIEYPVPVENFKNGSGIERLYNIKTKNADDEYIKDTMMQVYEKSGYTYPVCITITNLTYDIPVKTNDAMGKSKDFDDSGVIYDFVICNIIPLTFAEVSLYYDEKAENLKKNDSESNKLVLEKKVSDAFIYPVVNDDTPDVNYVLYKTNTPKDPNRLLVNEFLQCEYTMSGVEESEGIQAVIYGTFGDEVAPDTIFGMKKSIVNIEKENEKDENFEIPQLDVDDFSNIVEELGFEGEVVNTFERKYREALGDDGAVKTVNALNLENTVLKTAGVKVTVKQEHIDAVKIKKVDGVNSIVITIDEGLTIDDILVKP